VRIEDILALDVEDDCPGVKTTFDLPIREIGGWAQTVTICQPAERPSEPMPVAVQVHGGGFRMFHYGPNLAFARYWARELGMTTILPRYRLGTPDAPTFPQPIEDVAFCWEWVQAHAAEWGIDPERMTVGGTSAGGTLSAYCAVRGMLPGCRGLLEFWGPMDFVSRWFDNGEKQGGDANLLGANYPDNVTLYHEASVVTHVKPGLPPALFIHGIQDTTVHRRQGQLGFSAWKKAGNHAELAEFDNIGHGIVGDNTAQMVKVTERATAFLRSVI